MESLESWRGKPKMLMVEEKGWLKKPHPGIIFRGVLPPLFSINKKPEVMNYIDLNKYQNYL
ncbi:MAG TPA: hypothetical protein VNN20_09515 [Thermodesulfobacteriota bacterium]|nr:hypothetical protein [Thermodesulfobacteriota bacterium]